MTRLTLFRLTLKQDSALSVSGLDRESSADHPFNIVDGVPVLVGRGIKGSAVAMAKRFFDPLPRAISDDIRNGALRRSAWEFADARPVEPRVRPRLRAGVGIAHRTGARKHGVLYDHEVIPAGTEWKLEIRVDWSYVLDGHAEAQRVVGILGYVLARHWQHGRCWMGGDVARGLGWCTATTVKAYELDADKYDRWVRSGRDITLPAPLTDIPCVEPTRSWRFRTLNATIAFGENRPNESSDAWGLDMLSVGPHSAEGTIQPRGDGTWARPSWSVAGATMPDTVITDRPMLMEGGRPLIPGASLRGPLRHAFSRRQRAAGHNVQDPHAVQGKVDEHDPAGKVFGTVDRSSRVLIRDARANAGWSAAKLHMHAEDEFSAGSYGSAKRDAVRLLCGSFPVCIVVEGPTDDDVNPLVAAIDRQIALGALGHLPIGGHKTRGAGWGRWRAAAWTRCDVDPMPASEASSGPPHAAATGPESTPRPTRAPFLTIPGAKSGRVTVSRGRLGGPELTLQEAADKARAFLNKQTLVAWWCDPTIVLNRQAPPVTFGTTWPVHEDALSVDEVAFYAENAVWRAVRTAGGVRWVGIAETAWPGGQEVGIVHTPAQLHAFRRFAAASTGTGQVLLREWHSGGALLGFTITKVAGRH